MGVFLPDFCDLLGFLVFYRYLQNYSEHRDPKYQNEQNHDHDINNLLPARFLRSFFTLDLFLILTFILVLSLACLMICHTDVELTFAEQLIFFDRILCTFHHADHCLLVFFAGVLLWQVAFIDLLRWDFVRFRWQVWSQWGILLSVIISCQFLHLYFFAL